MDDKEFSILKLYNELNKIPWHELRTKHTVSADFMNWAKDKADVEFVVSGINKKLLDYGFIERIPREIEINETNKITPDG